MQSLRFWLRPTESRSAFSQDPQVVPVKMVGESLNYRLSFPLLSQFLYYTDNLVSHQPERIPPLQREGGDVLSTTRLFQWAKVEDIRTFACLQFLSCKQGLKLTQSVTLKSSCSRGRSWPASSNPIEGFQGAWHGSRAELALVCWVW